MSAPIQPSQPRHSGKNAAVRAAFFLSVPALAVAAAVTFAACSSGAGEPAAALSPPARGAAEFAYVHPEWHGKDDFKRITEFFTGTEATGGDIVVRSTPDVREGLYFTIGLPLRTHFPAESELKIEYLRGNSREIHSQTFLLPASSQQPFFEIRAGLTGPQWPSHLDAKQRAHARGGSGEHGSAEAPSAVRLVAWRVTLRAPDGRVWRKHSFLWELPDAGKPPPRTPEKAKESDALRA